MLKGESRVCAGGLGARVWVLMGVVFRVGREDSSRQQVLPDEGAQRAVLFPDSITSTLS